MTEDQVEKLNEHLDFNNFKKNKMVNFEEFQESGVFTKDSCFVRKGENWNFCSIYIFLLFKYLQYLIEGTTLT